MEYGEDEILDYLNKIESEGKLQYWGAAFYLQQEFPEMDYREAKNWDVKWRNIKYKAEELSNPVKKENEIFAYLSKMVDKDGFLPWGITFYLQKEFPSMTPNEADKYQREWYLFQDKLNELENIVRGKNDG